MTAPELETCGTCMGSGYGGHPDSGVLCPDCGGTGGVSSLAPEVQAMTARQIIEARLGRSLGPIATMPRDIRRALYLLALQLVRKP